MNFLVDELRIRTDLEKYNENGLQITRFSEKTIFFNYLYYSFYISYIKGKYVFSLQDDMLLSEDDLELFFSIINTLKAIFK